MTTAEALAFVRKHGVVLESAAGPVPSLAGAIAGSAIDGSWWGHPRNREIFTLTRAVRDSADILVCRLVDGKITYVHRRVWPALVRLAARFPAKRLARIQEKHTVSGRHLVDEISLSRWVTKKLSAEARRLDEPAALRELGAWIT